jgi:hypothetical protein
MLTLRAIADEMPTMQPRLRKKQVPTIKSIMLQEVAQRIRQVRFQDQSLLDSLF